MTQERIWRLDADGDPTPLTATDYDDEADLQQLIAAVSVGSDPW